ncbi:Hsp20/alpha crystallin family protein [Streptomyces sp. NPDC060064]|uniref:Hsp20/alpha crystallin family protein n=1 Tax=Streptomyces sp. NPDC060064 TaxID=3347049 RepID=UPI0036A6582F
MMLNVRREALPALWDSFREFEDHFDRLGQLWRSAVPGGGGLADAWVPPTDEEETEDAYQIELELPGVSKDRITVDVTDSQLAVHGEVEEKERSGVLHRQTRRFGRFDFRWALPSDADTDHVTAELADGVLTVRVPKAEKSRPRRVEITG